jgi:hypothetical protein
MAHREEIPDGSAIVLLAELDFTIAEGRKGDIFGAVAFALDALYRMSGADARLPAASLHAPAARDGERRSN